MDDLTKRRLTHNEEVFRVLNEEIQHLSRRFDLYTPDFVCECADADCVATLSVPGAEYEQIRSDRQLFVIAPGHNRPEIEEIVEDRGDYQIVKKFQPTQ